MSETRKSSFLILAAAVVWIGGQWLGKTFGAPIWIAFVLDIAALLLLGGAAVMLVKKIKNNTPE